MALRFLLIFVVACATVALMGVVDALTVRRSPAIRRQPSVSLLRASTATTASQNHYRHDDAQEFPPTRVGLAGAGAIAFATAAILSKNGHDPMLWSPSGQGTARLVQGDAPLLSARGPLEHTFRPRIATSAQELVDQNDILILALPANGHKQVMDEIAPHIVESNLDHHRQHHVIVSSHASLGALYLSQRLLDEYSNRRMDMHGDGDENVAAGGQRLPPALITAWGTTVCTARRPSETQVDIKTIRNAVDLCTVPQSESLPALRVCQKLFPSTEFRPRDGLLAITLSNLNPQNHLGMALGNMSRMEKGEQWYQFHNATPKIGSFLEALDRERIDIAEALGVDVKSIHEHFSLSFHVPSTDSISDMSQEIFRQGNDVLGPDSSDSRYILEDVPFGLTLTVALGRLVGRPAVLHESGLRICSAMYGRDLAADNDLMQALDLDRLTLSDLQDAARTGQLQSRRTVRTSATSI